MAAYVQQLKLRDLVSELSNISWDSLKQVLLYLGLPKNKLDDIEVMNPTSVSRRTNALDCWLQMDVSASWQKVVVALVRCDVMAEAKRIGTKYNCHMYTDAVPMPHGPSDSYLVSISAASGALSQAII